MNSFILLVLGFSFLFFVGGCASYTNKPFTAQEETDWMKAYTQSMDKAEPQELIDNLDKNVKRLNSKADASDAVNWLVARIYSYNQEMTTKANGLQSALKTYKEKQVDFNNPQDLNKVDDQTLKAFIEESQKRHYIIIENQGEFEPKPDVKYVFDRYGTYVGDDLKALSEITIDENTKPFFNKDSNTFNLDIVRDRILKLEDMIKTYADSNNIDGMKGMKDYYYQVYFGTNSTFLTDRNKKVLDHVITHYQEIVDKYPKSQLAKDTSAYLEKLNQNNDIVSDNAYVWLLEMTHAKTTTATSVPNPQQQTTPAK